MKTISCKVSVLQNGLNHSCRPISFPSTFLWLLPNIEQKRIPLNDNIIWCKSSTVTKDLSNSDRYLTSLLTLRANLTYFLKNIPHKNKSWMASSQRWSSQNLKGFFAKISPLRSEKVSSFNLTRFHCQLMT